MQKWLIAIFIFSQLQMTAQSVEQNIDDVVSEISTLDKQREVLFGKLEILKLEKIILDLREIKYPDEEVIEHAGMALAYDENHEQAKWVMHMILPEIKNGKVGRTNDFRIDPKVASGTTVQQDYFLTDTLSDGTVEYDGFGYDRGHLAPSADFRWSSKALSESYYYSNMSPQLADFNRQKWADMETFLRAYVIRNNTPLHILTAPVLHEGLGKIKQSINGVSIPEYFVKAAYDPKNKIAIAFSMPNEKLNYPLEHYAISIDEAEEALGYDIFPTIDEKIESDIDKNEWFDGFNNGDTEPLYQPAMPREHFNTIVGGRKLKEECTVCGTVVASRYSRKGNLWLNLDKQYPNQLFSVFIRKDDITNFSFDPKLAYESKVVCFKGVVKDFNKTPTMNIQSEKQVKFFNL